MKVLVTGKNGQLAQCIYNQYPNWTYVDRTQFDITNPEQMNLYLENNQFDFCINTAAYTNVDEAEDTGIESNLMINSTCLGVMATILVKHNIFLIHISSDYVYGDSSSTIMDENFPTKPINNYGKAKLEGEQAIVAASSKSIILRTSWLYSDLTKNFNHTMIKLTLDRPELKVIQDQIGTPTNCYDLASDLAIICNKLFVSGDYVRSDDKRIYNYSNLGITSWYDFATLIKSVHNPISKCYIRPCLSTEYQTKALRQKNSNLSKEKIIQEFGLIIPNWIDSYLGLYK
jgi:dTDP-4-dehydrorhamnose reductase